jgi:cell division septation protein DedD
VVVQAGAYSTPSLAAQAVASLAAKGFGGFTVVGSGPYRVQRGGLSRDDANQLVRALRAAGIAAYVRG